ncbi:MAG: ABC transporter ATP-binding protein [Chitinophagales bacterium]
MNLLKTYLAKYQLQFYWACLNSTLNKILDLMPPIIVGWLVDSLSGNIPSFLNSNGQTSVKEVIYIVIVLTTIIFLLESFFEWLFDRGFRRIAQNIQHDVRLDVYNKVQSLPQSYFENNRLGNILAILNDDINQLERFLNESFNEILQMFVLFIFASIALSSLSWELALVGMAPIPLIIGGSLLYQKLIAPRYKKMRDTIGILNSRLENNISGIQVVKMFNAEKFESNRVEEASATYKNDNYKIIDLNVAYIPLIRIFITAGFALGLLLAALWVIQDNGKMSLGGIALYAMLVQRLLWPVTRLGKIFDDFERSRASVRRIEGVLSEKEEPHSNNQLALTIPFQLIEVKNLNFAYKVENIVLENINFHVKMGTSLGIVGPTGAGKTTLIKLLTRLYEVDSGQILIDGRNLSDIDLKEWRSQISIVNQDAYLFHGSIKENIAYGQPDIPMEDIEKAAKMAHLHDFVGTLPDKYDSLIGERGIKLSGGQRQRLSLARAILKNAPLMILDEATSAVDTQTERAIQENIDYLSQNKTLIIIAHRLSTVKNTDNIIVLNQGRIAEEGHHNDLLNIKNGIYKDLWSIQTGDAQKHL